MIYSIIACGDSAKDWIPRGVCLGVNDAAKWGKPLDALLVCNRPEQFETERLDTIINTRARFFSNKANWVRWFPGWEKVSMVTWYGNYNPKQVYSSGTSPFIAITLAAKLGAKDIILWGVDMLVHHIYNTKNPQTDREIRNYLQLFDALAEKEIRVWLGSKGSCFDNYLPLWPKDA
jgi:hypothetical protein